MCIIDEYIGLRAKSYSNNLFYIDNEAFKCKKKSKGVPSRHIANRVNFSDYKNCLFNKVNIKLGDKDAIKEEHREPIYSFRSFNLSTYSIEQSKIALSGNDDKRYILEDNIHTLALGHYKIPL